MNTAQLLIIIYTFGIMKQALAATLYLLHCKQLQGGTVRVKIWGRE